MNRNLLLSSIPKVDEVLNIESLSEQLKDIPRVIVVEAIRGALNDVRTFILQCSDEQLIDYSIDINSILKAIIENAHAMSQRHLKRVINGTGVVIHTNLGRSILCREAVDAVLNVAQNYSNLEYDVEGGIRGSRYSHLEYIISKITGAESAIAVNNNAAAILLVLSTLCKGKEAVVSRGELIEIGGSFRIPEVMEQSGAILREVGTTNRTHRADYENAINENTGILLKVHTSNYRILGFTEAVSSNELADLVRSNDIPVVEDIGSGSFIDFSKYGLSYEPTVQDAIKAGVDIVTFSGDKMLGGPQAGIIAGRKKYIDRMKKNPLARALRLDKMTIAALEATLRKYLDEGEAVDEIPTVGMIVASKEAIYKRAEQLLEVLKKSTGKRAEYSIAEENSQIGGGSMPLENLPTSVIVIKSLNISANQLEESLRKADIPIIVRVQNNSIFIDIRTVRDDEFSIISNTLDKIL